MPFKFFTSGPEKTRNTKTNELLWRGHRVLVSRKAMKSIRLKLANNGELKLSCPHFVSDAELSHFLDDRQFWIEQQQRKLASLQAEKDNMRLSGHLLLWGEQRELTSLLKGSLEGSSEEQAEKVRQKILRTELKAFIARQLPTWQDKLGVQAEFWNVKAMKTKWGSCNVVKKRVWLNLQLASYPEICAQMVLVHELVHLLEPSHNKRFYHLMDTHLPDWRSADDILKKAHL